MADKKATGADNTSAPTSKDQKAEYQAQIAQLIEENRVLTEALATGQQPSAAAEPVATPHDHAQQLLLRYGLAQAWQDAAGIIYFDENAALSAAGGNADSLTLITPAS